MKVSAKASPTSHDPAEETVSRGNRGAPGRAPAPTRRAGSESLEAPASRASLAAAGQPIFQRKDAKTQRRRTVPRPCDPPTWRQVEIVSPEARRTSPRSAKGRSLFASLRLSVETEGRSACGFAKGVDPVQSQKQPRDDNVLDMFLFCCHISTLPESARSTGGGGNPAQGFAPRPAAGAKSSGNV
jgi:hypothetical protein